MLALLHVNNYHTGSYYRIPDCRRTVNDIGGLGVLSPSKKALGYIMQCSTYMCKAFNMIMTCSYTGDATAKLPASSPDAWCLDGPT